ncbi:MAG TPA: hypothetical protein VHT49_05220 [Acidimicrobiales bacterium]|nr:hypothetical protein [Acidimicrobiales bacterium]
MFERSETVVRCEEGHLFTTIWIPMVSIKAVRLGNARWQHCPVGKHWTRVTPVEASTLDPDALAAARGVHDIRLP